MTSSPLTYSKTAESPEGSAIVRCMFAGRPVGSTTVCTRKVSLRQRVEDIPLLLNHFIEKHCRNMGKPVLQVSKATMKELQSRDWPGNIRELENVVERAVISSRGSMFEVSDWISDLIPLEGAETTNGVLAPAPATAPIDHTLEQLEREHIVSTLERLHWRVEGEGGAAAALGLNASTLRGRMRKHGIRRPGSRLSS